MIAYDVYRNGGDGGPIDYAAPVASGVAALSWSEAPGDGDWSYAVRARDTASGLAELNADATARVVIAGGLDVTGRPDPPTLPAAVPLSGGRLRVRWAWRRAKGGTPTAFKVWLSPGTSVNYAASPAATAAYVAGTAVFEAILSGLAAGPHAVAIRATNAVGDEPGTAAAATLTYPAAPAAVPSLAATATATA